MTAGGRGPSCGRRPCARTWPGDTGVPLREGDLVPADGEGCANTTLRCGPVGVVAPPCLAASPREFHGRHHHHSSSWRSREGHPSAPPSPARALLLSFRPGHLQQKQENESNNGPQSPLHLWLHPQATLEGYEIGRMVTWMHANFC
jgi:hypothetical protein